MSQLQGAVQRDRSYVARRPWPRALWALWSLVRRAGPPVGRAADGAGIRTAGGNVTRAGRRAPDSDRPARWLGSGRCRCGRTRLRQFPGHWPRGLSLFGRGHREGVHRCAGLAETVRRFAHQGAPLPRRTARRRAFRIRCRRTPGRRGHHARGSQGRDRKRHRRVLTPRGGVRLQRRGEYRRDRRPRLHQPAPHARERARLGLSRRRGRTHSRTKHHSRKTRRLSIAR